MINLIQTALAADTEKELRTAGTIGNYITILYKWLIPFGAGLAVLMIIYAGYLYITSGGNPDNIKQAKDYIIGALVGLALIILAGIILKNIIGVSL
ncbi:MAG: hypothetical protein WCV58_04550 [Patescibacteria group bacterium]|jgi:hypothetical protein